jgi:hypothetical protein
MDSEAQRNEKKQHKIGKDLLAESSTIDAHDNPITWRESIPVFELAHILESVLHPFCEKKALTGFRRWPDPRLTRCWPC